MYPQITAIHSIRFGPQVLRSLFACARHARMVTLGVMLVLAVGCGGGGSGGGPETPAAIASTPVDLPPGQTTAVLEWAPSEGDVGGYYVLQSRGGSKFSFTNFSATTEVEISGREGDRVRIQVIARSRTGSFSAPSPPSVEMRFHAAVEAVPTEAATRTVAGAPNTIAAVTVAASAIEPDSGNDSVALNVANPDATEGPASGFESVDEGDRTTNPDEVPAATLSIDPELRARLLSADVRLPLRSHASDPGLWLQGYVDAEIGAGLALVGTGNSDSDAFRELIWTDQSGQLFVSDGAALASLASSTTSITSTASTDSATTGDPTRLFTEAFRLHATERFVALADFDGDGVGDWLIEDSATLELWVMNGKTQDAIAVEDAMRLVGHGDFDGDGRSELLWSDADGSFRLSHPTTAPTTVDGLEADPELAKTATPFESVAWLEAATFDLAASRLLTVDDLDGDGRDDLLFLDTAGRLQAALSVRRSSETDGVLFAPTIWSERSTAGLELIATLDLDGDGSIEIAWHDGVGLELWNTRTTP